jgi:hypothetical protein
MNDDLDEDDIEARMARLTARIAKATERIAEHNKPPVPERSRMSVREKAQFISEHGQAEYLKLPWAHDHA